MKKSLVVLALALALGTGSAAQAQVQDYVMCPGDVLQVVVYGHEDLSTLAGNTQNSPYVVRPDGKVSFPLIGDVDVTGKTGEPLRLLPGEAADQCECGEAGYYACVCAG